MSASESNNDKLGEFVSILIACFTVGYGQAQLSYYIDVDPTERQTMPKFHGYIGNTNKKRMLTIFFQALFTFCFALNKAVGISLGMIELGYIFMGLWGVCVFIIFIIGIKITIGRVRSWIHFDKCLDGVIATIVIRLSEWH